MIKRLNETLNEGRDAKRARLDVDRNQAASFEKFLSLPTETQIQIIGEVVDTRDPVGSLKSLAAVSRTSNRLKDQVDRVINRRNIATQDTKSNINKNDPEIIKEKIKVIDKFTDRLEKIPLETIAYDRKSLKLNYLISEADFMPIKSSDERTRIIKGLLKYSHKELPQTAIHSFIDNIEYAKAAERSRITTYAFDYEKKGESVYFAEDLVERLIKKSQHLTSDERSELIKKNFMFLEEDDAKRAATGWADKMHLLNENEQKQILENFQDGSETSNRYLHHFAEHLDKFSPTNRSALAKTITELPSEQEGRWRAFSHLAKNLKHLNEQDRATVSSVILDNRETLNNESIGHDNEQEWYAKAEFCKHEAIYHLSKRRTFLSSENRINIDSFISRTTDSTDPNDQSAKAQFIDYMTGEKRTSFVKQALADDGDDRLYGLTVRIKELSENEKTDYVAHITDRNTVSGPSQDCVGYNIRHNIKDFSETQRSDLVKRQLKIIRDGETENYIGPALSNIANIADQLQHSDIEKIINTTWRVTRDHADDELTDSARDQVNSWASHAARGLAEWAGATLARGKSFYEPSTQPVQIGATAERNDRARGSSISI